MIEIERKFLVTSNAFKTEAFKKTRISQGFLNTNKERTVRVRLKGEQGFITVKGKSSNDGLSRFEWEKEISKQEAEALLKLCEPTSIDKIRYEVKIENHIFEVDEFFAKNEGLIIAEVELNSENEVFEKPNWLGEVKPNRIRKSLAAERTFSENLSSEVFMLEKLKHIADEVCRRLIKNKVAGKTVTLKIKYSDFSLQTRSKTLPYYISDKDIILETAKDLLYQEKLNNSVRLLGISLSNLNTKKKKTPIEKKSISVQLKFEF